jgi:hypothetical protein
LAGLAGLMVVAVPPLRAAAPSTFRSVGQR